MAKHGEKYRPIAWTQTKIAREFGMDSRTVGKRLATLPTKKAKFTTLEVCRALFGDMDSEKLRLTREQADKVALENAEARRELVPAGAMYESVGKCFSALVTTIQACSYLETEDKNKLINHLRQTVEHTARLCASTDATPELHGEPVGRAVPLS